MLHFPQKVLGRPRQARFWLLLVAIILVTVLLGIKNGPDTLIVSNAGPPLYAMEVDGGQYFQYHRSGIRAAMAPREVVFTQTCDECTREGSPDIISMSVFGGEYRKYETGAKVMFVGEPWSGIRNDEVATIVHCKKDEPGTKYFPFWVSSFGERRKNIPEDLIQRERDWDEIYNSKTEFCAFMYSHESQARDDLFDLISTRYKQVKSIGAWKHNDNRFEVDRGINNEEITYNDLAVEKYKSFKFVIAAENNINLRGYITEKIVSAMFANAIPIYLGAPDIAEHFNPKSFINANEMSSEELLETIRMLDQNKTAYLEMLQEPYFVGNALPDWFSPKNHSALFQDLIPYLPS